LTAKIDSQKHPVIELVRDLQTEKGREELGQFYVEGSMIVHRALEYGVRIDSIICTDKFAVSHTSGGILDAARVSGIPTYAITEGLMGKVIPAKPAPGVIAIVERKLHSPADILAGTSPLVVLIDRCENPDNLGMLLRSLDAAGVDGVVFTDDCVDPFSRLSVRASRGSVLSLNLSVVDQPEHWVEDAKLRGFQTVASSAHGNVGLWTVDFSRPTIIVVGNEHTGVRESIRELADILTVIPMSGKMESLNIAVSGAILAYEAIRQRRS
jgi:TrmH family RNA methyltransferase